MQKAPHATKDLKETECEENGKAVLVLKHYAMKAYGGMDTQILVFLTSEIIGGEWSASRPGRLRI
jgi:hypothetical protein